MAKKKAVEAPKEIKKEVKALSPKRPKISLITCTGGRPECFKLLEAHMAKQSFKDFEHIVVDDSYPATQMNMGQKYFRGPVDWRPGLNTQRGNMEVALSQVQGDFIFFIEDDEYYHPDYLLNMMGAFRNSMLVGLSNARYYKVDMPGYAILQNYQHASLSQTAVSRSILHLVKNAVNSGFFYFDIELWKAARALQIPMTLIGNSNLSIGIKGMAGRPGLTPGHKENKGFMMDPSLDVFKKWVGDAVFNQYKSFLRQPKIANKQNKGIQNGSEGKLLSGKREIRKLLSGRSDESGTMQGSQDG